MMGLCYDISIDISMLSIGIRSTAAGLLLAAMNGGSHMWNMYIYIYTCKEYGLLIYVNKSSTGKGNGTVVFLSSTGSGTTP